MARQLWPNNLFGVVARGLFPELFTGSDHRNSRMARGFPELSALFTRLTKDFLFEDSPTIVSGT